MNDNCQDLRAGILEKINEGRFNEVMADVLLYRTEMEQDIRRMPAPEARSSMAALLADMKQFLHLAQSERAHRSAELASVSAFARYIAPYIRESSWHVQG